MTDASVIAGGNTSGRVTLQASPVVNTIAFADDLPRVELYSDGSAWVFFTIDGSTPTVDGPNTYPLPAGAVAVDQRAPANNAGTGTIVKLITTGTPVVTVTRG